MGLDVTYKGSQIAQLTEDGSLTLETAGTYCEGDIELAYSGGIDTSDANATAADILSGKTAYVNGNKVTGNIAFQPAQTITPGTTNQTITSGKYLTGVQTIKGDANLVASNIAEGISIFGITGTHAGGGGGDDALATFIEGPIEGVFENSKATQIRKYLFYYCSALTSVSFPVCTWISDYAFGSCSALTSVSFPACRSIGFKAFSGCSRLTSVNFPACTSIGNYAFGSCSALTSVSFPVCTLISDYAFSGCSRLTSVSFPACTSIGWSGFADCTSFTSVSFPACTSIGSYAFHYCHSLTVAIFSALQTAQSIYAQAFRQCYNLRSLYLLASTVYKLQNVNVFSSTPISNYTTSTGGVNGSIFVKESLYASYIAATNWVTYSARFVSLTDEQVAKVMASGTHI